MEKKYPPTGDRGVLETMACGGYRHPCAKRTGRSYPISYTVSHLSIRGGLTCPAWTGTRPVGATPPAHRSATRYASPRRTSTSSPPSRSPISAAWNVAPGLPPVISTACLASMLPTTSAYSNGGCRTNHSSTNQATVKGKAKALSMLRGNASMSKAAEGGTRNHGRYRNQTHPRRSDTNPPSWVRPFHTLKGKLG